jgi:hypothetical protein
MRLLSGSSLTAMRGKGVINRFVARGVPPLNSSDSLLLGHDLVFDLLVSRSRKDFLLRQLVLPVLWGGKRVGSCGEDGETLG